MEIISGTFLFLGVRLRVNRGNMFYVDPKIRSRRRH